ncbi:hypothetical protein CapIbe_019182 [Capra ibex]
MELTICSRPLLTRPQAFHSRGPQLASGGKPGPLWSPGDGNVCSIQMSAPRHLMQSRTWMSWDRALPGGLAWCWLWPLSSFQGSAISLLPLLG